jgi:hypothetical protein
VKKERKRHTLCKTQKSHLLEDPDQTIPHPSRYFTSKKVYNKEYNPKIYVSKKYFKKKLIQWHFGTLPVAQLSCPPKHLVRQMKHSSVGDPTGQYLDTVFR